MDRVVIYHYKSHHHLSHHILMRD